ncbi:MAG: glycoside hydrolase family 19 protein [Gammaproteobacteria bacterium]
MTLTLDQLQEIMPHAGKRAAIFLGPLNDTMERYAINTPKRMAAFLAQLAHESGELRYVRELASGEDYERRKDLGNTRPGDGVKFKGRGLIQITGRANYHAVSAALGIDFVIKPALMELPENAAMVSGWFWDSRNLNELADEDDFRGITRRINGGYNGWEDRLKYWERAKRVLGVVAA